jgi:hypothetical protein
MISIIDRYHTAPADSIKRMKQSATAKLFMHGRSQAVRLPKAFRLSRALHQSLSAKAVRARACGRRAAEPFHDSISGTV